MSSTTLFIFTPRGFQTLRTEPTALAAALAKVFAGQPYGSAFDAAGGSPDTRLIGYSLADLAPGTYADPTVLTRVPGAARGVLTYGPLVVVPSTESGTPRAATPAEVTVLTPAQADGPWDLDLTRLVAE